MRITDRPRRRFVCIIAALLLLISAVPFVGSALHQQEPALAIRPQNQRASVPDGFSVWHYLNDNGIHFKSITPQNNSLVIRFDSFAQSVAAKAVLDRTLPSGYIIARQDDDCQTAAWLSRLRDSTHLFG